MSISPDHGSAPLVWDTTAIFHAVRADRDDVLHDAAGPGREHLVVDVVAEELRRRGVGVPDWLTPVGEADSLSGLSYLNAFAEWCTLLRADPPLGRNAGEAATLAWVQVYGGVALVDDGDARRVAQARRREGDPWCVHGSLWAIARAVVEGRQRSHAYAGLCAAMLDDGIYWKLPAGGFAAWFELNRDSLEASCR